MKGEKTRVIISISLKISLAVFSVWGLTKCFFGSGFMSGSTLILYFTIQSNIWIAGTDILLALLQFRALRKGSYVLNERLYKLQQVFTVSITLTGIVFCFVLVPAFWAQGDIGMSIILAHEQIFLHVATPLLAVIDLLCFTRHSNLKKIQCLWASVPPLYYLGFASVGYLKSWDFGGGNNYPYFFLNYGSPAGIFGFSKEMPYFMGAFYWILALLVFVLGISLLYIVIINSREKVYRKNLLKNERTAS